MTLVHKWLEGHTDNGLKCGILKRSYYGNSTWFKSLAESSLMEDELGTATRGSECMYWSARNYVGNKGLLDVVLLM